MWLAHRAIAISACTFFAASCSALWTESPTAGDDSESPVDGLSPEELITFAAGDEAFERQFSATEGLGPVFNQVACSACHLGDGAGHPDNALIRFSRGAELLLELGGPQLQDRSIGGTSPERLPANVQTSTRVAPVVHGMGLIEAIPVRSLLASSDPNDDNGDGISGRPNCVRLPPYADRSTPQLENWLIESAQECAAGEVVGRFGWKANTATLVQQVTNAYLQDMGITSEYEPDEANAQAFGGSVPGDLAPDPEIPSTDVQLTTAYVRMLAAPRPGPIAGAALRGKELFQTLRCDACHIPELQTADSPVLALRDVSALLYSDLLLHDMGPALADDRPDGAANGSEWRTTPLWGLRIKGDFTGGKAFYMHDGRTSDLGEAITLHGGEARTSQEEYLSLAAADQEALLAFLRTL